MSERQGVGRAGDESKTLFFSIRTIFGSMLKITDWPFASKPGLCEVAVRRLHCKSERDQPFSGAQRPHGDNVAIDLDHELLHATFWGLGIIIEAKRGG
jgi:hypothetical protein